MEGLATRVGFSGWPLSTRLDFAVPDCACEPGFKIVFGPPVTLVLGALVAAGAAGLGASATGSGFARIIGFGGSSIGCGWFSVTDDLVPSIHSTVSGAQSPSSSSMSAHLASFPASSMGKRVARWMPYCCLSSSSVYCFGGAGGTGWFLFHTLLASGPDPAPLSCPIVRGAFAVPDLATRRGFAVSRDEVGGCTAGAAFRPGDADGVDAADFARKLFVTDTDLKAAGFFVELVRTWLASCFEGSTLPGRLMSVSEPLTASPLTADDSAPESSAESPFGRESLASLRTDADCFTWSEAYNV